MPKCKCENPVSMHPHGADFEVDPCVYEEIERHEGVTVIISKCKNCGHIDVSWERGEE